VDDINNGIDGTKVKPGIIGEVGCSWPLAEMERRSLQGAAIAQSQTKTPVMIHPGRDPTAPFEDLRIFQEAGGDAKHTVIAHLGRTISNKDTLLELAETGVYNKLDHVTSMTSKMDLLQPKIGRSLQVKTGRKGPWEIFGHSHHPMVDCIHFKPAHCFTTSRPWERG
jgi:predicted metal-dependent phosphotriesterase family hydrolase